MQLSRKELKTMRQEIELHKTQSPNGGEALYATSAATFEALLDRIQDLQDEVGELEAEVADLIRTSEDQEEDF